MCKMNVVVNRVMLGNRELGWETWNGKNIEEYTSKQLQDMIRGGKDKVYGLCLGKDGELEADAEGFFTTSVMEHRHIGNYRPMDSESLVNMAYICYGTDKVEGKTVYKCISNKFEQVNLTDEQIKAYLTLGVLTGGARLKDGRIEVAKMENTDNKPVEPEVKEPVQEPVKPVAKEDKVETSDKKKEGKPDVSKKDDKKAVAPVAKTITTGKRGK